MPTTLAPSNERTQVRTPGGHIATFETRPGTSDSALVGGIIGEDEYGLRDLPPLTGWAIDIGAHIGTVSVALALDHPGLRVVAVEAIPENVDVLRANVRLNGLGTSNTSVEFQKLPPKKNRHVRVPVTGRVQIWEAAASSEDEYHLDRKLGITYGWSRAQNQPDAYMSDNRFIGGMVGPNETSTTISCQPISLTPLLAWMGISEVELLKIDCEGCEWFFLTSPMIGRCKRIWGELHHGKRGGAAEFRRLLEPTHDVEMDDSKVVSLFRATRHVS